MVNYNILLWKLRTDSIYSKKNNNNKTSDWKEETKKEEKGSKNFELIDKVIKSNMVLSNKLIYFIVSI